MTSKGPPGVSLVVLAPSGAPKAVAPSQEPASPLHSGVALIASGTLASVAGCDPEAVASSIRGLVLVDPYQANF
jgi:hypothetical protein